MKWNVCKWLDLWYFVDEVCHLHLRGMKRLFGFRQMTWQWMATNVVRCGCNVVALTRTMKFVVVNWWYSRGTENVVSAPLHLWQKKRIRYMEIYNFNSTWRWPECDHNEQFCKVEVDVYVGRNTVWVWDILLICSAVDINQLDRFLNRSKRFGYCCQTSPSINELFDAADESLFKTVLFNSYHVLHRIYQKKRQNCTVQS